MRLEVEHGQPRPPLPVKRITIEIEEFSGDSVYFATRSTARPNAHVATVRLSKRDWLDLVEVMRPWAESASE